MYIKTASSARTDCAKTYRKHSNRQAVGELSWSADANASGPQTAAPNTGTAFIVTSAGGPIGYQNLAGELSSWTGRPPAGTLLNPLSGRITQVKTERCHLEGKDKGLGYNEKPRLCVALDYLHVMHGLPEKGAIQKPLAFKVALQLEVRDVRFDLLLSAQMKKLRCIQSVTLWVFEQTGKGKRAVKTWHRITTNLDQPGAPTRLTVPSAHVGLLAGAFAAGVAMASGVPGAPLGVGRRVQAAFCEVGLKTPEGMVKNEDWAKDMQCSDPWVFPVQVFSADGRGLSRIERPAGELGEVPDWDFLANTFASKGYIPALKAIKPYAA